MMPSLFRTKQQMQGQGHLIHGEHFTTVQIFNSF
jgi:cytochrome c-type biogenesis protein CcmE